MKLQVNKVKICRRFSDTVSYEIDFTTSFLHMRTPASVGVNYDIINEILAWAHWFWSSPLWPLH